MSKSKKYKRDVFDNPVKSSCCFIRRPLRGIEPLTLLVLEPLSNITVRDSCVQSAPGCLKRKSPNNVGERGEGFSLVKYRGSFIYICKRHHLEYCKPATPRWATLGCSPDSQQSGPGWISSFRGKRHGLYTEWEAEVKVLPQFLLRQFGKKLPNTMSAEWVHKPRVSSPGRAGGWTFLGRCNVTTTFRRSHTHHRLMHS